MWLAATHRLPPAWNPLEPLDLRAPPNPLTGLKRLILAHDPVLCRAALATSSFPVSTVVGQAGSDACPLVAPVRVRSGIVALEPSSFLASCRLAVDMSLFQSHVLQPVASRDLGTRVTALHHLGSYACRDVRGGNALSAHATADAIDVSGFTLADGRTLGVSAWKRPDAARFLHDLRDGACDVFGMVLSPDFNGDHAGHLHLQATGWGFCR